MAQETILTVLTIIGIDVILTLIGGLMLIGFAVGLVMSEKNEKVSVKAGVSLSSAISTIVFADIIMGLDNVLAVAGAANGNYLYVLLGLIVSVPIIISGSKLMLFFFDKVPFFMYFGAVILAFTARKMIANEEAISNLTNGITTLIPIFTVLLVLCWTILSKTLNQSIIGK